MKKSRIAGIVLGLLICMAPWATNQIFFMGKPKAISVTATTPPVEKKPESKKATDFGLWVALGALIFTGWQALSTRRTILDGRISRLALVIEGDDWLREIKDTTGKTRFEITAAIRNVSSNACILHWISADASRFFLSLNKGQNIPHGQNHSLYTTQVIDAGKTLPIKTVSGVEFTPEDVSDFKFSFEETIRTNARLRPRLCFHGVIAYRTLFDEEYRTHFFGYVEWDRRGKPCYADSIPKFNYTERTSPTWKLFWINFLAKRKWGLPVMQRYYRVKVALADGYRKTLAFLKPEQPV